MANLGTIISTAKKTLAILEMLEPVLGEDTPFIKTGLSIAGRVISGAVTGKASYDTLVTELEELNVEMEAVQARGGATADDLRAEVALIEERGARLDALLERLQG